MDELPDADAILSYLPNTEICERNIRCMMINEVVADAPENDFYSETANSYYMGTTLPLFEKAGFHVNGIGDILAAGIYITNAIRLPKQETTIDADTIRKHAPFLEREIDLFPNLRAVMLMGDVAKKMFNLIGKQKTGKNPIPSTSTYKLRKSETYFGEIRVFPSYIMTGKNILIEKSKVEMAAEDIEKMLALIAMR